MATHPGLHVAVAAVTAVVLFARWAATRRPRDRHGTGAARPPWRRVAPESGTGAVETGAAGPYALSEEPVWQEADAYLDRCWKQLASLYPRRAGEGRTG
ncbi:hypothetical protein SNE510_62790 [Streptomyces sp. NE5-10]|uniref:hypothetical protein n=1 Tax=Streptomyces sp. NE5-10 TaxID=2759674 RepID=UPI0019089907|nr:hypothetical protein [Streptomyces sp. NE5-10]GHJ96760.1 hypothetical protein SNE510_62790 [Streptomyces sp. NE5-10]